MTHVSAAVCHRQMLSHVSTVSDMTELLKLEISQLISYNYNVYSPKEG